eukprot:3825360-Pyramimonas_sp.AAC.1
MHDIARHCGADTRRAAAQVDSTYRLSHTDPWVWGDKFRTSRTVFINNNTSSGNAVHGKPPEGGRQTAFVGLNPQQ